MCVCQYSVILEIFRSDIHILLGMVEAPVDFSFIKVSPRQKKFFTGLAPFDGSSTHLVDIYILYTYYNTY